MTELICPFCGKPLLACIYNQNDIIYCCDNKDCVYYDDADNQNAKHYLATPEFWQALIDTKKKLDKAKHRLMQIAYLNMSEHGIGSDKMMIDWCKTVASTGLKEIEENEEQ